MISADYDHIADIINVHMLSFEKSLLTKLGSAFLKIYYRTILEFNNGILLISLDENKLINGFVSGFMYPRDFYSLLNSYRFKLALASIPALIKHPSIIKVVFGNALSMKDNNDFKKQLSSKACELSSIAVHPKDQGKGLGKKILKKFETEAKLLGADQIYLYTDSFNNDKVNQFYKANGYELIRVFNAPGNRQRNKYLLDLK
jgi:ribosomal protein S18 acetylase RimI-like enzyme